MSGLGRDRLSEEGGSRSRVKVGKETVDTTVDRQRCETRISLACWKNNKIIVMGTIETGEPLSPSGEPLVEVDELGNGREVVLVSALLRKERKTSRTRCSRDKAGNMSK